MASYAVSMGAASPPLIYFPAPTWADLIGRVAELSGRDRGTLDYIMRRPMRERGSIYIAANRGSEWRAGYGTRGFVLKQVPAGINQPALDEADPSL